MLLAARDARRATVDADFLVRNLNLDEESVLRRVVEIAALPASVEDGVEFRPDTVTAISIRDGDLYGGVRIAMDATVAGAVVELRLDISTGDPVAPPRTVADYPTLLTDHPRLSILGYPLPVVLAEKPCTAVELGAGNSRVRDYAGIWTLTRSHDITAADLLTALARRPSTAMSPFGRSLRSSATTAASVQAPIPATDAASDQTPPNSPRPTRRSSTTSSPSQTQHWRPTSRVKPFGLP